MNQQDERKIQLLNDLLEKINRQNYIYNLNYDEETNCINYHIVYNLDYIRDYQIHLTKHNINNPNILKLLKKILLRFSLLKHKTRENINNKLIDEYISTLTVSPSPIKIIDEIDQRTLIKKLQERKNNIIEYLDSEIVTRASLSTLENLILLCIFTIANKTIANYIFVYTLLSPFIYTYLPYKIDIFKNKKKYDKTIKKLIKKEIKNQPDLKFFCILNKKIHELSDEDENYYQNEINKLKKILEDYYNSGRINENHIDLNVIDQIEEIFNEIEFKKNNRTSTPSLVDEREKSYLKKI